MTKFFVLLLIGLVFEALGVALLSRGLKSMGSPDTTGWVELGRFLAQGLTQPSILLGVACEAVFFGILLYLLAQRDVSLVWPLTSLGFVLTALMARFLLGEQVSAARWAGVILIVLGATLVSWSECTKPKTLAAPASQSVMNRE